MFLKYSLVAVNPFFVEPWSSFPLSQSRLKWVRQWSFKTVEVLLEFPKCFIWQLPTRHAVIEIPEGHAPVDAAHLVLEAVELPGEILHRPILELSRLGLDQGLQQSD